MVTRTVSSVTGVDGRVVGDDLWLTGCWYLLLPDYVNACPSLHRVDGRTGALEAEVALDGLPVDPVRVDDDTLAVRLDTGVHTPMWITVVDTRRNAVVTAYDLPPADFSAGIAFGAGSLWVADWSANTITRTEVP